MADAHIAEQVRGSVTTVLVITWRFIARHYGWFLWAAGALLLVVMAVLAHSEPQFPGDAAISGLLQRFRGTALAPIIDFPSNINQPLPGGVITVVVVIALAVLRRVIEALVVAVATFGTDLLNALINGLVARPRPNNIHVATVSGLGAHSFPSGHVEHVTMLFGFLIFLILLVRRAQPERWKWLIPLLVICVYFIALIGVGRVVEGDHQPSDVLGGYLVAALMLPLAILFYRWLGARWQRHQQRKALARASYSDLIAR